jgi:hypothetical protein
MGLGLVFRPYLERSLGSWTFKALMWMVEKCEEGQNFVVRSYDRIADCGYSRNFSHRYVVHSTGKSLSEALLFAENGENMLCTKIVLNIRNNFCTQHVLPRFELGIFMYWTCSWSKYKSFWQRFTCTHIVTCLRC